jgi:hypothetical protein
VTYHTALSPPESDAEPREWWAADNCQAFVHDIMGGIAGDYVDADVIYSEIPWADGFDEFNRRAQGNLIPLAYPEWLYRLSGMLYNFKRPWVLVGGYAMVRHVASEWIKPVALNGSQAAAIGANLPKPPDECRDALEVLQWIAGHPAYKIVGDPCCGYGRTGRVFVEAGKWFVMSDINPQCIGHVAREAPKWLSSTI